MLDKTLELLRQYDPKQKIEHGIKYFDENEVDDLGKLLKRILFSPPELRKELEKHGIILSRGDFYSDIPTVLEIEESVKTTLNLKQIFGRSEFLREYLQELTVFSKEFDPPLASTAASEFGWNSGAYSYSDAMAYYAMIRKNRPRRIVEFGCGTSTLVARDAVAKNGRGEIICFEPFPSDVLRSLDGIKLNEVKAQEVDIDMLNSIIQDGDIFFIDTTHTVKHNSDCLHIYLRLLSEIKHDIFVHVHDIYLPGPYPDYLLYNHQIFWTEQYLLYAYLLDNPRAEILFGSAYHIRENKDLLSNLMHGRFAPGGAAFWFHQKKRHK